MKNNIHTLKKTISELNKKHVETLQPIENLLQQAYNTLFDDMSVWKNAYSRLEQSNDYTTDQFDGWPCQWIRCEELSKLDEDDREYFKTWLDETYCAVDIDWNNECLVMRNGPAIIIDENGDVYDQDSRKRIIERNEYLDEANHVDKDKRNQLIEDYMKRTGYFPGVFTMDKYGNVYPVNTQKKGE